MVTLMKQNKIQVHPLKSQRSQSLPFDVPAGPVVTDVSLGLTIIMKALNLRLRLRKEL